MGEYGDIPPDLPALWAALGRCDRAESSVRFVADYERGEALAALAGPMAAAGEPDQAERLVHAMQVRPGEIRDPYNRTRAWTDLAWRAAVSCDGERAAGLIRRAYAEARAITQPYFQSLLLLTWSRVYAAGGDPARADELASRAEAVATETATGPSTVARIIHNQEMVEAARRIVRALNISGLIGFDFMIEAATGAAYLIEMNPRHTPICALRLGPGRDLPEALLAKIAGRPVRERPPRTERDIIVSFPETWMLDPTSNFLRSGFHDVPWEQPALVRRLIQPERRERYLIFRLLRKAWHARRPHSAA